MRENIKIVTQQQIDHGTMLHIAELALMIKDIIAPTINDTVDGEIVDKLLQSIITQANKITIKEPV